MQTTEHLWLSDGSQTVFLLWLILKLFTQEVSLYLGLSLVPGITISDHQLSLSFQWNLVIELFSLPQIALFIMKLEAFLKLYPLIQCPQFLKALDGEFVEPR